MKTVLVLLLFSMVTFGQEYAQLFKNDLPKSLVVSNEVISDAVKAHFERNVLLGAEVIYIYLEHLELRFGQNIRESDKNLFNEYNAAVENAVYKRNNYLKSASDKLFSGKPEFWKNKLRFLEIMDEWKINQDITSEAKQSGITFDENKLYYYYYKLALNDASITYQPSENYKSKYTLRARQLVEDVKIKLDQQKIENIDEIISTVNTNFWLFADITNNKPEIEQSLSAEKIVEILAEKDYSGTKRFYLTAGYSIQYPEIDAELYYKIVSFNPTFVTEKMHTTFGASTLVSLGAGYRISLLPDKTYLSYIDLNVNGAFSFSNSFKDDYVDNSIFLTKEDVPLAIRRDYYHKNLENASADFWLLNVSLGTPIFRVGKNFELGVEIDLLYAEMSIKNNMFKLAEAVEVTYTESITDVVVLPGLWFDVHLFGDTYARVKGVGNGYINFGFATFL